MQEYFAASLISKTEEEVRKLVYKTTLTKKFGYDGYTEVVDIDGEEFVVSVLFDSKMSPSEERQFLEVLTEFNELNNLTPIEV